MRLITPNYPTFIQPRHPIKPVITPPSHPRQTILTRPYHLHTSPHSHSRTPPHPLHPTQPHLPPPIIPTPHNKHSSTTSPKHQNEPIRLGVNNVTLQHSSFPLHTHHPHTLSTPPPHLNPTYPHPILPRNTRTRPSSHPTQPSLHPTQPPIQRPQHLTTPYSHPSSHPPLCATSTPILHPPSTYPHPILPRNTRTHVHHIRLTPVPINHLS